MSGPVFFGFFFLAFFGYSFGVSGRSVYKFARVTGMATTETVFEVLLVILYGFGLLVFGHRSVS